MRLRRGILASSWGWVMRLGMRQLEKLQTCGTAFSQVVPDRCVIKLIERGFMTSDNPDGSFAYITPQGLRALADAIDSGRISICKNRKDLSRE